MPRPATNITIVLALLAALALPVAAGASRDQTMTFDAPRDLLDPAQRDRAMAELDSLGVRSLRVVLYWRSVAPQAESRVKPRFDETNPDSYDWNQYDRVMLAAKQRGWSVLLTISGPVPRWATNGARDQYTRPSPSEYAKFVEAATRRYGDDVDRIALWNEPNHPEYLRPQYSRRGKPLSPGIYRKLVQAGMRGVRDAGHPDLPILIGDTAPRGTGKVVAPLTFLRGTLCLDDAGHRRKSCGKLAVDGYAHHAYTTSEGPFFVPPGPNDVTIGVVSRLTRALDRGAAAGALPRTLPIWLTEFGIQSKPDPFVGVSLSTQAEYRAIAERMAYDNPRVRSFSQYLLRDDEPKEGAGELARYSGFESGLRTSDGKAKPALDAFRLTLAAQRSGGGVSLWGLVRPAGGRTKVVLEQSVGRSGRFEKLATIATDERGVFRRRVADAAGRRWRLVWTSPQGTTFRGPPTHAHAR